VTLGREVGVPRGRGKMPARWKYDATGDRNAIPADRRENEGGGRKYYQQALSANHYACCCFIGGSLLYSWRSRPYSYHILLCFTVPVSTSMLI